VAWCSPAASALVKFLKSPHDLLMIPAAEVGQIVHVRIGLLVVQIIELVWRDCLYRVRRTSLSIIAVKFCWATVCKTVRPIVPLSVHLVLSCLSVTLVYCGQTVRWMKMKLGTQIGAGHIMLDGDPALPPRKGAHQSPHTFAIYGCRLCLRRCNPRPCLL